ncbi:hypothetical protein DR864_26025 [Runella rosea]|uniref:Phage integrase family protein n=1 Tax=Runella rosea TaxID=2259595 RepID=A0A344TQN0_9BACT|nr:hypothetical protein [Runella rosea]AXE20951.1 hypothetical protein DR864_26025 [Runella rosea]
MINNELKDIASMIGVSKLTTHIARHSFAEIAKQKTGGYVAAVSAALDHSSIAIATAYFKMLHRQKTTLWLILFLEIDF